MKTFDIQNSKYKLASIYIPIYKEVFVEWGSDGLGEGVIGDGGISRIEQSCMPEMMFNFSNRKD